MVLRIALFTLAISLLALPSMALGDPLILYYVQRPPFMWRDAQGKVTGVLVTLTAAAFAKAGVAIIWKEASPPRQLAIIESNQSRVCALGRYKTPERLAFAKFSIPYYQDSASVGLANVNFKVSDHARAADLMADPNVTILLKDDIRLGPYTEDLISHMKAKRLGTSNDYEQIIRMIKAGRADFALFSGEEEAYYRNKLGFTDKDFKIIHFPDMPPGEKRYLMCSKQVEDAVLEKINAELK
jgi:ABC-type amino acid transport substrate-binding protein